MTTYLLKVRELLATFEKYEICQIPRSQNSHADALARLATAPNVEFLGAIPVEFLAAPSADQQAEVLAIDAPQGSWMNPIVAYLKDGELLEDKLEACRLRACSAQYCLYDEKLYKKGFSIPLLRCIDGVDCQAMLEEIHAR